MSHSQTDNRLQLGYTPGRGGAFKGLCLKVQSGASGYGTLCGSRIGRDGLDATEAELAARRPLVKGFAVGRTIFGPAARDWSAGRIDDGQAIAIMAENYSRICRIWGEARADLKNEVEA